MKKTVEVPVVWLENLMRLGEDASVSIYSGPTIGTLACKDDTKLVLLKGYIQSASQFLDQDDE